MCQAVESVWNLERFLLIHPRSLRSLLPWGALYHTALGIWLRAQARWAPQGLAGRWADMHPISHWLHARVTPLALTAQYSNRIAFLTHCTWDCTTSIYHWVVKTQWQCHCTWAGRCKYGVGNPDHREPNNLQSFFPVKLKTAYSAYQLMMVFKYCKDHGYNGYIRGFTVVLHGFCIRSHHFCTAS